MNDQTKTRRGFSKYSRRPELYKYRFQKRDLEILRLLNEHRAVRTDHITALFPGDPRTIKDRLKYLYHDGYIDRYVDHRKVRTRTGSDKNIHLLTSKARKLLEDEGCEVTRTDWDKKNVDIRERNVEHQLMVTNFWAAMELGCRQKGNVEIGTWKENQGRGKSSNPDITDNVIVKLKEGKEMKIGIVPDAYFSLEYKGYERFHFLEAERTFKGTSQNDQRYYRKFLAYQEWRTQKGCKKKLGIEGFRLLVVTPDVRMRDRIRNVVIEREITPGGVFWFTTEQYFSLDYPESFWGPIWLTAKDDQMRSLLD